QQPRRVREARASALKSPFRVGARAQATPQGGLAGSQRAARRVLFPPANRAGGSTSARRSGNLLPDRTAVRGRHRRPRSALEGVGEVWIVGDRSVDAPLRRRVRVRQRLRARRFGTVVRAPDLREGDERLLLVVETAGVGRCLILSLRAQ